MAAFKIGVNMAGAISAGAYTAGVLDFLTEALDEWYKARSRGEAVLSHDVLIEVLAGASAGGMCAAISAAMLQEDFEHISDTAKRGTRNVLYESWVNRIDIRELLKTSDLKSGKPVVSLLDPEIIEQIAAYALNPGAPNSANVLAAPRPYVSPDLTLFLSLTNLRGVPYSLNAAAPSSLEETTLFFGDRIRFEAVHAGKRSPLAACAHPLDVTRPGAAGGWDVLATAAMATGAFPVFLAPRLLKRNFAEYTPPMWESVTSAAEGTPPPIPPSFPPGLAEPLVTLNVDGGVTNNDPFNMAHDYLVSLDPACSAAQAASSSAMSADRAVINIAPFPTMEKFDTEFAAEEQSSIFSVLPRLFSALISQSRFFGESLSQIMTGTTFGRFVIAPSDPELEAEQSRRNLKDRAAALQCASLGAFGGFFKREFRAHDYALGRRNCQKFLRDYFVLPADNVVMEPALRGLDAETRDKLLSRFGRPAPGTYAEPAAMLAQKGQALPKEQVTPSNVWLPIIPLCSDAVSKDILPVARDKMSPADLKSIVKLIVGRYRALVPLLLTHVGSLPLRIFLRTGQPVIRRLIRRPIRRALIRGLGDSYRS